MKLDEDTSASRHLPPVVYLACVEHVSDPEDTVVEYRATSDGRLAVLVYSALDRLQRCCGTDQPWLVVPTKVLDRLRQARPFDVVLLDVVVPDEYRTVAPERSEPVHTIVRSGGT